jgi:RNA polymerase sigma factor (sigma-70 family)
LRKLFHDGRTNTASTRRLDAGPVARLASGRQIVRVSASTEATVSTEPTASAGAIVARLVEHRGEFLGFLQRRVGDRALAEDLLQEAFARSLDKAGQIEQEESAVAWFYRVLRNSITDYQRRTGSRAQKLEALQRELSEPVEPELERAVCECVRGLAETLKPEYAAALRAVEVQGMPVKDFAAAQGISSNNAAVRVFRAREALRLQVKKCCGSCADDNCRDCTCHADHTPIAYPDGSSPRHG